MNTTANTERYLLLDQAADWRVGYREGLSLTAEGSFTLDPLPGRSQPLLAVEQEKAAFDHNTPVFVSPSALTLVPEDGCGTDSQQVLVADARTNLIKRLDLSKLLVTDPGTHEVTRRDVQLTDLCKTTIDTLPTIGGTGIAPRQLQKPQGIAVLPSGAIVVADTSNHRVQIFSPPSYALLQVWGATDGLGQPVSGTGQRQFSRPWDVASDAHGNVYVADRGNHRIQKIAYDGTWLEEIGTGHFHDPMRLAVGPASLLALVDQAQQQKVFIITRDGHKSIVLPDEKDPRTLSFNACSITFDDKGRIYVGDDLGLVHVFAPDSERKTGYRYVGTGTTSVIGEIVDLVWDDTYGLLAIIHEQVEYANGPTTRIWQINPAGAFAEDGKLVTTTLDSGIEHCQWHRILLNATLPKQTDSFGYGESFTPQARLGGTSLRIESCTSDELLTDSQGKPDSSRFPDDSADWKLCLLTGDRDPDCLVQSGPGRYLWLRLTFRSNGVAAPVLHRIKTFYPRVGYLQYLPAVFQEDDESRLFLERFLAIFQTEFDHLDQEIDNLWQLFDPASVPQKHLDWLAGWLALFINPEWPELKKRQMLKEAFHAYQRRGTVDGVEQAVRDYADVHFAKVVEHFRLRRWPVFQAATTSDGKVWPSQAMTAPLDGSVRLWSRDFYQRLQVTSYSQVGSFRLTGHPEPALEPLDWGAHRFTVFFPADPYQVEATKQKVSRVVTREKPAHTEATLCPVLPRFRVGVQSTIGVDSVVGGISHLTLNQLATLNYDSILSCSVPEHNLRAQGSAVHPRVGVTTKLP